MLIRSLRVRVILGSLLWTAGLLGLSHMASLLLMRHFRTWVFTMHNGGILGTAFVLLLFAGLTGLRSGLSPFSRLRERLTAVRQGKAARVDGDYPNEVQPLVTDLNALLEHRERIMQRALATAGDLAHGLKTPLAVLAQEAANAATAGHEELARSLNEQVEKMRRQVEYHLAHARAAASGATPGARCDVAETAEGIRRTLQRLHRHRELSIELEIPGGQVVQCQKEDLEEMLGNLIDNACKWARGRVKVQSVHTGDTVTITVDDDGPGVPIAMREAVLRRGARADQAGAGSGLGLAIVRDLTEMYGGSITLGDGPLGGLRASVRLISA